MGDLDFDKVNNLLEENLGDIAPSTQNLPCLAHPLLTETKNVEIIQPDLNQAHILKGWLAASADSEDYASIALLNIILGASGLSSRLFLELRDKKGLAYVVRSAYDVARLSANFSIYIATEPNNIETSLKGFDEEIKKIKTIPVSEEELENAKITYSVNGHLSEKQIRSRQIGLLITELWGSVLISMKKPLKRLKRLHRRILLPVPISTLTILMYCLS